MWLGGGAHLVLVVHLEVVHQVLTDTAQWGDSGDAKGGEHRRVAHARLLQQLRRRDRAARDDHLLVCPVVRQLAVRAHRFDSHGARPATGGGGRADGGRGGGAMRGVAAGLSASLTLRLALPHDAARQYARGHRERRVRAHRRLEVRRRRRAALARARTGVEYGGGHRREALLAATVVVAGRAVPSLRPGAHKGVVQRRAEGVAPVGDVQRPAAAAPTWLHVEVVGGSTGRAHVFHASKVGQHVRGIPATAGPVEALVPRVKVARMAADVHHAVDGGGAAEALAARARNGAPLQGGLSVRRVAPVVRLLVHRHRQCGRELRDDAGPGAAERLPAACLQE